MDNVDSGRAPRLQAGVELFGDPVGKRADFGDMRDHRPAPADGQAAFGRRQEPTRADEKKFALIVAVRFEHALGEVKDPPVERTGKALLGANCNDEMTGSSRALLRGQVVHERQSPADRRADRRGVSAHAHDMGARLPGSRPGNPSHRPNHRGQLLYRADSSNDVAEPLGHGRAPSVTSARTAATSFARAASSQVPLVMTSNTASGASASS